MHLPTSCNDLGTICLHWSPPNIYVWIIMHFNKFYYIWNPESKKKKTKETHEERSLYEVGISNEVWNGRLSERLQVYMFWVFWHVDPLKSKSHVNRWQYNTYNKGTSLWTCGLSMNDGTCNTARDVFCCGPCWNYILRTSSSVIAGSVGSYSWEKWESSSCGWGEFRNPEVGEHTLLEAATKQQWVQTEKIFMCCSYSDLWSVELIETVIVICSYACKCSKSVSLITSPNLVSAVTWQYIVAYLLRAWRVKSAKTQSYILISKHLITSLHK